MDMVDSMIGPIQIGDEADSFVPPPDGVPPSGDVSSSGRETDTLPEWQESLIRASLVGGEEGQLSAFYGEGEFAQILREGTTFELRRSSIETEGEGENPISFSGGEIEERSSPLLSDSLEPVFSQHYTNLRQALDFLSQRDSMAETVAMVGPPTQEQQQREGLSPLNRQFVDVLTYHEQRQAHLRRALLEES
jgi:hypothetical protein